MKMEPTRAIGLRSSQGRNTKAAFNPALKGGVFKRRSINLAKSAGFCFGVKRALEIALKTLTSGAKVSMLGDIVHNEQVAQQMRRAGMKKIERWGPGKNKIFLIRAHGISLKLAEKARRLGYKIIDATCPMVKEIHKIAKSLEQKGYSVIVIGDKKHDEVQGIIGQLKNKAVVIDAPERIKLKPLEGIKKAGVVVQSTQNPETVRKIFAALKAHIKEIKFFDTICRPTKIKQEEIKKMPLENDAMIIIGSKTSANTKRLYEISKSLNKKSFWIQSKKDIKADWFKGVQNVGITAGASTPDSTIKEIVGYMKGLKLKLANALFCLSIIFLFALSYARP